MGSQKTAKSIYIKAKRILLRRVKKRTDYL